MIQVVEFEEYTHYLYIHLLAETLLHPIGKQFLLGHYFQIHNLVENFVLALRLPRWLLIPETH